MGFVARVAFSSPEKVKLEKRVPMGVWQLTAGKKGFKIMLQDAPPKMKTQAQCSLIKDGFSGRDERGNKQVCRRRQQKARIAD